jgi:Annexin
MSEPQLPGDLPLVTVVAHANQIHQAFKGIMSCDEDALISVFKTLTSRHAIQVCQEYNKTRGKELASKIKGETKGKFRDLLQELVRSNAELDADRLNGALKSLLCDEETLIRVLAGRTNAEISQICEKYQAMFSKDLVKHLKDRLSGKEEQFIYSLLHGGRVEDGSRFNLEADMNSLQQAIGAKNFTVGKIWY